LKSSLFCDVEWRWLVDLLVGGFVIVVIIIISTTGWTVRVSNPGRSESFRTCPDQSWGPPSLLYNGYRVFLGGKAAGAWR